MKTLTLNQLRRLILPLVALLLASSQVHAASLGTWPAVNIGKPAKLFVSSVAYGNGTWVAVGQGGFISTSPDGKTWTKRSAGITRDFNHVTFDSGRFIAVCKAPDTGSGAKIWISSNNGATWQFRNSDAGGDSITMGLHSVAGNGSGNLVAVGGLTAKMTRSYDGGATWHVVSLPAGASSGLYGVGYGNGVWIACGYNLIIKSTDAGATWTVVSTSKGGRDVAYGNSRWLMADVWGNAFRWSSNTVDWVDAVRTADAGGGSIFNYAHACTYFDGLFVAVTEYGDVYTSENGRQFRLWKAAGGDADAWGVAGNNRLFVAVGGDFTLKYGVAWNSPPWLRARLGSTWDHPFTAFDAEDAPLKKIALPEYRVNTASLNLTLEGTLFNMPALGSSIALKLAYGSGPVADTSTDIGIFGKNWHTPFETMVGQFGPDARVITGGGRSLLYSTPSGVDLFTVANGAGLALNPPDGVFDKLVFDGPANGFRLTQKGSRMTYFYGKAGGPGNAIWYLTKIADRNGNQITFDITTSAAGRVINSIKDGANRTVSFNYNASNLCTRLNSPDGRHVDFTYDSRKNLTSITDMMGYKAIYEYDAKGFLMSMNTAGRVNHFTWLPRPGYEDAASAQDNAGDLILSKIVNSTGGVITYELLPNDGGLKRTDAKGLVTTFKSEKGETTSIADPLGKIRTIAYGDQKLPTTVKDELGSLASAEYDARGNQTKVMDALGNVNTFTYDPHDNLLTRTDPQSNVWTFTYGANDNLATTRTPLGFVTTYAYHPNGQLHQVTDPRSGVTTNVYNANGDLTSSTAPMGGAAVQAYDGMGRCISMTDRSGSIKSIFYDNNNRITRLRYDSVAGLPTRLFAYDAFGQTSFTDETGATSAIQRNDFGFITRLTDPLGGSMLTDYDADNQPVKATDPLGRVTTTSYDSKGRPILITDPLGKTIVKEYNASGSLLSLTDKRKAKTSFAYDANHRLTQVTNPLSQKISHQRDTLGRVTTTTNARGDQIRVTYDADGRLTRKEYQPKGGAFADEATTVYDQSANLTSRSDKWGTTTWTYDAANRITSTTYPTGTTLGVTYTSSSQVASLTYPGGLVVNYTYDAFNRHKVPSSFTSGSEAVGTVEPASNIIQVSFTLNGQTRTLNFTHDNAGRLLSIQRPAGNVQSTFVYDTAGRTTSIDHTVGATTYFHWALGFDAVGNILSEASTGTVVHGGLLPAATTMTYDLANRIKTRGTSTYTHDADGNLSLVSGAALQATYTPENHPTEIVRKPDGVTETIENTFDGGGLRVERQIGTQTVVYHYGANNHLLYTTDDTDTVLAYYIWGDRVLLAAIEGTSIPTGLRYYLTGRLSSIAATVDDSGALVASYAYDPTGNCQRFEHQAGVPDKNPFTFVGGLGVIDDGHGLYYMGQRFYDATLGRFIQRDPAGFEGGINLYAYASGNPANMVDPAGTWDINWSLLGKGVVKVGAAAVAVGVLAVSAPVTGTLATVAAGVMAVDAGLNAATGGVTILAALTEPKAEEKLKGMEDWDSLEKGVGRMTAMVYTAGKSAYNGKSVDPKELEENMNVGGQLGTAGGLALNLVPGSIPNAYKAVEVLANGSAANDAFNSLTETTTTLSSELGDACGSSAPASNSPSDSTYQPTYYGRGMER